MVCAQLGLMTGISCPYDLQPPLVVQSRILSPLFRGVHYLGEPYIFIQPDLSERESPAVAIHETTHYVRGITDPKARTESTCESEEYARRVTDKLMGREYDDSWREIKFYGCDFDS